MVHLGTHVIHDLQPQPYTYIAYDPPYNPWNLTLNAKVVLGLLGAN